VQAVQPDHLTLNQRSLRTYGTPMTHAFLHAAVAPSRRIRPGRTEDFVEQAAALAGALGLPTLPSLADADNQRFVVEDHDGSHVRDLLVTRSGLLEMLWALEQLPTDDGVWAVRAVEAGSQLTHFVCLVRGNDYGRLLGSSRWSRTLHSRVDWTLGVTVTTAGDAGQRGWRDIIVVGPQPDRASGHAFGFMPPRGYGVGTLYGVRRTLGPEPIIRVMLHEWLQANGYLRTSEAVERTLSAAASGSVPGSRA
jgi:hypothetical protein